ncbi:hypothetical protein AAVH_28146 [Aphelenchoides avenae]|nr:hypothetical protein AAVH_28146 [Aphelenchus avenae]
MHDGALRQATPHEAAEGKNAAWCAPRQNHVSYRGLIVATALLVAIAASIIAAVTMRPELFKTMTQEQRTARIVVEQMREELGMKAQSQNDQRHERHAQKSTRNAQTGPNIESFSAGHNQRLDRIETLMVRLAETLDVVEGRARRLSAPWDSAHADSPVDGRTQELDLRLDRLESIMVQLHEKLVAIEKVSTSETPTQSSSQLSE